MSNTIISVEHLTKRYDLGVIGIGTLSDADIFLIKNYLIIFEMEIGRVE
ncbi:MAG: hypothetical protein MUO40_07820 [Anaerolineaceae bacterium]|nr:hypothetical protein [Anaerolineaceae bacterium]